MASGESAQRASIRWGESPNAVSMFNNAAKQMYAATHTK
jgi:hypothetical protein